MGVKMETKKILIVDDQKDITFILSTLLKFHKLEVLTLNNSSDAVEKIESENFVLAVLDYMMPGKTGIDVAKEIRQNPKIQSIQLVLYTVKNLTKEELAVLKQLDVIYIKKPMPPNDFVKKIVELIGNK